MKKTILFFSMAFFAFSSFSQTIDRLVIASGGGSSANAKISYTVGETVTQTLKATNGTLSQGFQQGISVSGISLNSEVFTISAYPNPTAGSVKVTWDLQNAGTLDFRIFNVSSTVVMEKQVEDANETILDLTALAAGTYLLSVSGKDVKATFNIIKQ